MPIPYRKKAYGKVVGSYYYRKPGGGLVNLGTKDESEAYRRMNAELKAMGQPTVDKGERSAPPNQPSVAVPKRWPSPPTSAPVTDGATSPITPPATASAPTSAEAILDAWQVDGKAPIDTPVESDGWDGNADIDSPDSPQVTIDDSPHSNSVPNPPSGKSDTPSDKPQIVRRARKAVDRRIIEGLARVATAITVVAANLTVPLLGRNPPQDADDEDGSELIQLGWELQTEELFFEREPRPWHLIVAGTCGLIAVKYIDGTPIVKRPKMPIDVKLASVPNPDSVG
jgi:hypothetical protein